MAFNPFVYDIVFDECKGNKKDYTCCEAFSIATNNIFYQFTIQVVGGSLNIRSKQTTGTPVPGTSISVAEANARINLSITAANKALKETEKALLKFLKYLKDAPCCVKQAAAIQRLALAAFEEIFLAGANLTYSTVLTTTASTLELRLAEINLALKCSLQKVLKAKKCEKKKKEKCAKC